MFVHGVQVYIDGLGGKKVRRKYPEHTSGMGTILPDNWNKFEKDISEEGGACISFSSTDGPDIAAIAIHPADYLNESAISRLEEGRAFGFIVDRKVLLQIRAALDVLIAATDR